MMNNWYVIMRFATGRDDDHQEWTREYGPYSEGEAKQIKSEIQRRSAEGRKNCPFWWGVMIQQVHPKTTDEILLLLKEEAEKYN